MNQSYQVSNQYGKGVNDSFLSELQDLDVPVLTLVRFAKRTLIDFGDVCVNQSTTRYLRIQNDENSSQELSVEKLPSQEGFSIREIVFIVPPKSKTVLIPIVWTPTKVGKFKCSILFLWNEKRRLQVTLTGESVSSDSESLTLSNQSSMYLKRGLSTDTKYKNISKTLLKGRISLKDSAMASSSFAINRKKNQRKRAQLSSTRIPLGELKSSELNLGEPKPKKLKRDHTSSKRDEKENEAKYKLKSNKNTKKKEEEKQEDVQKQKEKKEKELQEWIQSLPITELQLEEEILYITNKHNNLCSTLERRKSLEALKKNLSYFKCKKVNLLLKWTQSICATYGVSIQSFTVSFEKDLQEYIFKLLVNFYKQSPLTFEELFPDKEIRRKLRDDEQIKQRMKEKDMYRKAEETNTFWTITFSPQKTSIKIDEDKKSLNMNEEKTLVTKVSHLCLKLLTIRKKYQILKCFIRLQSMAKSSLRTSSFQRFSDKISFVQVVHRVPHHKFRYMQSMDKIVEMQSIFKSKSNYNTYKEELQKINHCTHQIETKNDVQIFTRKIRTNRNIQSITRSKRAMNVYVDMKNISMVVESMYRNFKQRGTHENNRNKFKYLQSNIQIQNQTSSIRKTRKNATKIQSMSRCKAEQTHFAFHQVRPFVLDIQSHKYMNDRCTFFNSKKSKIIWLQSYFNSIVHSGKKKAKTEVSTNLTSLIRTNKQACEFENRNLFATKLQSLVRTKWKNSDYIRTSLKGNYIQKIFESNECLYKLQGTRLTSTSVQSLSRGLTNFEVIQHNIGAAIKIQSKIRKSKSQKKILLRRDASTVCQSFLQSEKQNKSFGCISKGSLVSVSMVRRTKDTMNIKNTREKASEVQKLHRNCTQYSLYQKKRKIIVSLQSCLKSNDAIIQHQEIRNKTRQTQPFVQQNSKYSNFEKLKKSVLNIQSIMRKNQDRHELHLRDSLLKSISEFYRSKTTVESFKSTQSKCSVLPSILSLKTQKEDFENTMRLSSTYLQCVLRNEKDSYDFNIHKIFVNGIKKREKSSATLIQKVYRGYRYRKENPTIQIELSKRFEDARGRVKERKRLAVKTRKALKVLLNSKQMTHIMKACAELDQTTSVSENSQESLVREKAVPILFSLIKSCNRSKPHLQLLEHCLNILINLSMNPYVSNSVFECSNFFEVMVEQLQMYRDKEEIFMRALEVLKLQCNGNVSRMKKLHSKKPIMKRIDTITSLMQRKYQIEKKFLETFEKQRRLSTMNTSNMSSFSTSSSVSTSHISNRGTSNMRYNRSQSIVTCYEEIVKFVQSIEEIKK